MPGTSPQVYSLDEVGDPDAPIGSRPWAVYFLRLAKLARSKLDSDAKNLKELLASLEGGKAWTSLEYMSWGQMLTVELGLTEKQAKKILKAAPGDTVGDLAPLGKHGGDRTGEQGSDATLGVGRGAAYLVRRMKRDCPEKVEQLEAGEFKSVRQAAIAAGIVKVPSVIEQAKKLWMKMTEQERKEFQQWAIHTKQSA